MSHITKRTYESKNSLISFASLPESSSLLIEDIIKKVSKDEFESKYGTIQSFSVIDEIIQANAIGYKLRINFDATTDTDSSTTQTNKDWMEQEDGGDDNNKYMDIFIKTVIANDYIEKKKDWVDLRRTLLYIRTEVRFYKEFVPLLMEKVPSLHLNFPNVYYGHYHLTDWIEEDEIGHVSKPNPDINIQKNILQIKQQREEECHPNDKDLPGIPLPGNPMDKMGILVLECISDTNYYQKSPLSIQESKICLHSLAKLHIAGWEDLALLTLANEKLSKASFHLSLRNPKELSTIQETWSNFCNEFKEYMVQSNIYTESILALGIRLEKIAVTVSKQVSPTPTDKYATLIHGDYKSMNVFLPSQNNKQDGDNAILVDFASAGVGLAMSDLAMHIRHAILPEHLSMEIEKDIVKDYWDYLIALSEENGTTIDYPWELAYKHYKLAVIDYCRFFMARMWKNATPNTMELKANNANVNLINRSVPAVMSFLPIVDNYLSEMERELESTGSF